MLAIVHVLSLSIMSAPKALCNMHGHLRYEHNAAKSHFLVRLRDTAIQTSPYAHSHLLDVFPEAYYGAMIRLLPPLSLYHPIPDSIAYAAACRAQLGHPGERHHLWLSHLLNTQTFPPSSLPPSTQVFWQGLAAWLAGAEVVDALYTSFLRHSRPSTGPTKFRAALRFVKETCVSYVLPHTDQ